MWLGRQHRFSVRHCWEIVASWWSQDVHSEYIISSSCSFFCLPFYFILGGKSATKWRILGYLIMYFSTFSVVAWAKDSTTVHTPFRPFVLAVPVLRHDIFSLYCKLVMGKLFYFYPSSLKKSYWLRCWVYAYVYLLNVYIHMNTCMHVYTHLWIWVCVYLNGWLLVAHCSNK